MGKKKGDRQNKKEEMINEKGTRRKAKEERCDKDKRAWRKENGEREGEMRHEKGKERSKERSKKK